ncbi:unnamed protein product [Darwinula stevensoni]|uniref:START domain-containing protein n=1 Tax=Darwinula stevensoni TaxID=69355 RepID=A0A7R8XD57_9CRUS|nr:unnamed protein product [Darwinula stevensoni]CAG0894393.1 unnamed protein product [Darwinula stevensoni]
MLLFFAFADEFQSLAQHRGNAFNTLHPVPFDLLPYVEQGESAFREVKATLEKGAWSFEREDDGVQVRSLYSDKYKRYVFLSETVINASVEAIVEELWWHYDEATAWNRETTGVEIIKRISPDTMIARTIGADQGAAQFSTRRDFLSVYSRRQVGDSFYLGSFYPSGDVFTRRADGTTTFQSVLNIDIKVYAIFDPIVRLVTPLSLIKVAKALRAYAPTLMRD